VARYTVIGASGFIGARLVEALRAEGAEVFVPTRDDDRLYTDDLGRVFYCAGLTADYLARPFDTVEAHVALIARLLKGARFDRLVYCSSTRLYDWMGPEAGAEDAPLLLTPAEPRHLYDLSKALGENLCLTQSGGRASVARLACVWDAADGSPGFLSEWLQKARRTRTIALESSSGYVRDYITLDDTAAALRAILDSGEAAIFNVASGENVSNGELAAAFEAAGWSISLARETPVQPAPHCDIARLRGLGVEPVRVRDAIAALLAREDFREAG
jgi:nucleoside-diphosphate-sugar epimerase